MTGVTFTSSMGLSYNTVVQKSPTTALKCTTTGDISTRQMDIADIIPLK